MWPQQWRMGLAGFWSTRDTFRRGLFPQKIYKKFEKVIVGKLKTVPLSISYDRHWELSHWLFSLWCWGSLDICWFEAGQRCLQLEESFDKPTNWPDYSSELHIFWWLVVELKLENENKWAALGKGNPDFHREQLLHATGSCLSAARVIIQSPIAMLSISGLSLKHFGKCEGKMSSFPWIETLINCTEQSETVL